MGHAGHGRRCRSAVLDGSFWSGDQVALFDPIAPERLAFCLGSVLGADDIFGLEQNGTDGTFAQDRLIGFSFTFFGFFSGHRSGFYDATYTATGAVNTPPTLEFVDDVEVGLVASDTVIFGATDAETSLEPADLVFGYTTFPTCDASVARPQSFAGKRVVEIADESRNGQYNCASATDGENTVFLSSANRISASSGPLVSVSIDTTRLKVGELATVTFTTSRDAIVADPSRINVTTGTLAPIRGPGREFTAQFTPAANTATRGLIRVENRAFSADCIANNDAAEANNAVDFDVDTIVPSAIPPADVFDDQDSR